MLKLLIIKEAAAVTTSHTILTGIVKAFIAAPRASTIEIPLPKPGNSSINSEI